MNHFAYEIELFDEEARNRKEISHLQMFKTVKIERVTNPRNKSTIIVIDSLPFNSRVTVRVSALLEEALTLKSKTTIVEDKTTYGTAITRSFAASFSISRSPTLFLCSHGKVPDAGAFVTSKSGGHIAWVSLATSLATRDRDDERKACQVDP